PPDRLAEPRVARARDVSSDARLERLSLELSEAATVALLDETKGGIDQRRDEAILDRLEADHPALAREFPERVAPLVAEEAVVVVGARPGGNDHGGTATGLEHARHFAQRLNVIGDVLQEIRRNDRIDTAI